MLPPLWKHQEEAIHRATANRDFAFFMEPGCGKTRTMIETLTRLYAFNGRTLKTLIFTPVIVVPQWREEFLRFSDLPPSFVTTLVGTGERRLRDFSDRYKNSPIFITNYEALQMKSLYEAILAWGPEVLICDESQRIKNPSALRTKKIIPLADLSRHNYLLTGTPILNSQLDLFSQFRVLDRGDTFGRNYFAFRNSYFYDKNSGMPRDRYFPNWVPRPDTNDKLAAAIASKAVMIKKAECLDLPPLVKIEVPVALSAVQQRLYKEMKEDFITYVNDKACVAQLAITKALRLAQIVSGFVKTEDGSETHVEENPRLDALSELLDLYARDHKIIVWAKFHQNYDAIQGVCKALGLEFSELTGRMKKNRDAELKRFKEDPKCRVLVANPAAGGEGVNIIESSVSIYFSRDFNLGHDIQSEARNYRGGSERHEKITRFDLVARGTIDELILTALRNKQDLAEKITDLKKLLA